MSEKKLAKIFVNIANSDSAFNHVYATVFVERLFIGKVSNCSKKKPY